MTKYIQNSLLSRKENETIKEIQIISKVGLITNETDQTIFLALQESQPATRMELCKKTGIPRTTIYDALTRLILKKVVVKYSTPSKTKGRPKVFYKIA